MTGGAALRHDRNYAGPFDGMAIARQRIAEEVETRTGFLDLGGLRLTVLPPELFRLRHLRELNLGALPDADAATPIQRIQLAAHWKTQHDEIVALIREHGGEIIGTQDFERFRLMGDFYRHVPDILALMFDTVQPRSFEELVQHGFADA